MLSSSLSTYTLALRVKCCSLAEGMFLDTDFEKELSIEPILNSSAIPVNNYNYSCQISDLDEMLAPPPKLHGSEE